MKTYRMEPAAAPTAEQPELHIAGANCCDADSAVGFCALPAARLPAEAVPIWLAALFATSCEVQRNGENHAVRWDWISGRAVYTNAGREAEHIEPLGVSLLGGHTMAVYWMPGETAYTVEVYRQTEWRV